MFWSDTLGGHYVFLDYHVIGFDKTKRSEVRRYTVELHAASGDPEKAAAFRAFAEYSLLNAGHGTTVSGLTSLLWEVLRAPEIRARLIENPSLIPVAVEESMRRLNREIFDYLVVWRQACNGRMSSGGTHPSR